MELGKYEVVLLIIDTPIQQGIKNQQFYINKGILYV